MTSVARRCLTRCLACSFTAMLAALGCSSAIATSSSGSSSSADASAGGTGDPPAGTGCDACDTDAGTCCAPNTCAPRGKVTADGTFNGKPIPTTDAFVTISNYTNPGGSPTYQTDLTLNLTPYAYGCGYTLNGLHKADSELFTVQLGIGSMDAMPPLPSPGAYVNKGSYEGWVDISPISFDHTCVVRGSSYPGQTTLALLAVTPTHVKGTVDIKIDGVETYITFDAPVCNFPHGSEAVTCCAP